MSTFLQRLGPARLRLTEAHAGTATANPLRWVYIPYDQLAAQHPLLDDASAHETAVALIESPEKARKRPYHPQKLALLLSQQRHFALELAARGYRIAWHVSNGSFGDGLLRLQAQFGIPVLSLLQPAERELRADLADAVTRGLRLSERPNTLWLTEGSQFADACGAQPPWRMDSFYRAARRASGVLMQGGKPVGGKFSFDAENRKPWRGEPAVPQTPSYAPDKVTQEVLHLVERRFPHAFGSLAGFDWPCTRDEVAHWWRHVLTQRLRWFGPYEDAMAEAEPLLFHARVSPLLNLGRLTPRQVIDDVLLAWQQGDLPLQSAEGFVRQVLGWREYVRHVHEATDGFRSHGHGGAPNHLQATETLPAVYWGKAPSGLRCLDTAVDQVYRHGWSHHITRLMVLSNIATLLGVSPRALTDWFWVGYVDAFDWVVEPNVLGMGTFADGGSMMTKPYVSGAAYLHKMGDACSRCGFDPTGKDPSRPCPLTPLYWDFLHRNRHTLQAVERLALSLASARARSEVQKAHAAVVRTRVLHHLHAGERLPLDIAAQRASQDGA